MSKYYKADGVERAVELGLEYGFGFIAHILEEDTPTIDLVRCADCIFYTHGRNGECRKLNARMDADDYCSKGRKKGEDE